MDNMCIKLKENMDEPPYFIPRFKISRFIWKHSDTYTSVTRGHFLNNIYIQDMTEWTYDEK